MRFYVLTLCVVQSLALTDELWHQWKQAYNKTYDGVDEVLRRAIWNRNVKHINEHNRRHDLGLVTYTLGLNKFADLTFDEFRLKYLPDMSMNSASLPSGSSYKIESGPIPSSVDWRDLGYVTEVKSQGECGSCWAFSATGSIEAQYAKKFDKLKSFSVQQLVDCSKGFGNYGCNGGFMERAFNYLMVYGLEPESDYPYVAETCGCRYDPRKAVIRVAGYRIVHSRNESHLQALVARQGPASVGVFANGGFMFYKGGIYLSEKCPPDRLNHGVLVVGYGNENGIDYWILKNSWGKDWGEGGYLRLGRNAGNMCGIANLASVPVIIRNS